jgi:flavin reductase (DIM6/NTAB) family NADH-FMN oxidoreductase RutF
MECKVVNIMDLPTHDVFIAEILATYADESVLADDRIDIAKLKPLLFDMSSRKYWSLGPAVGDCWDVGKKMEGD